MSEKQNTEEQNQEQAKILKEKGIHELNNNNLKEALKYFTESYELKHDNSTEAYIHKCRKLINKEKLREEAAKAPDVDETPTNNQDAGPGPNLDQDQECQDVIDKKDYYEILGIAKEADENEIKRAYKKLAIRFHPDKNQSKLAEDAFKKISHAFQTLKDPEKKAIYDKYGSEEEIRERYSQQNHYSHHEEDDVDPFDLFEMFFSNNFGNVNYQRARQARRQRQEEYYREQEGNVRNSPRYNRNALLVQLLPLFMLMLFSAIPYLFQTRPYYQFEQNEEYHQKMTTAENKINYFVGDRFMKKYQTWDQIHDLEFYIEREYLSHLGHKCGNTLRLKNELEHKLSYYRNTAYRGMIKNELDNLDMNSCRDYYKYKSLVR